MMIGKVPFFGFERDQKEFSEAKNIYEQIFGRIWEYPDNWTKVSQAEYYANGDPMFFVSWMESRNMRSALGDGKYSQHQSAILCFAEIRGFATCVVGRGDSLSIEYCKFDCSKKAVEWMKTLPVEHDGEWQLNRVTSLPRKGIRDYYKKTQFTRMLTHVELVFWNMCLKNILCPGWTGVLISEPIPKDGGWEYNCSTTYDSSD